MVKIIFKIATFFLFVIIALLTLVSCEDVVSVDLETAKPRLVIDASIKWQKGTLGNEQLIKLSTTTGFYEEETPNVSGATVYITNEDNVVFTFNEIPSTGNYVCTTFAPELTKSYTLTVLYAGETYSATETFIATPSITDVAQNNEGGFTGNDIEVKFYFNDNGAEDNFYLIQFNTNDSPLPQYDVIDDTFFQGNQMFGLYTNEDLNSGDELLFTLHGISEGYYNYMNILLGVAGNNGGSPFQTPPANVRGNIINETQFENYAFGFFRLSEVDSYNYTIN